MYWCEDLKMEPVLAVFDGLTLQSGAKTGDDLKPYVEEALEEIEYVTGDVTTKWGAQRAANGHPAPFTLHYVEIGNEDNLSGGTATHDAWALGAFYDAIKAKYPNIQVIASATGGLRTHKPDVFDEHYYFNNNVNGALSGSRRYDSLANYPRDGSKPKVFVGEWATRVTAPTGGMFQTPSMLDALADAAWLTGLDAATQMSSSWPAMPPCLSTSTPGAQQWPLPTSSATTRQRRKASAPPPITARKCSTFRTWAPKRFPTNFLTTPPTFLSPPARTTKPATSS